MPECCFQGQAGVHGVRSYQFSDAPYTHHRASNFLWKRSLRFQWLAHKCSVLEILTSLFVVWISGCWRSFLKFWGDVYIIGTFHQRLRSPSFWCPGCSWNGIALDQHLRRCGCTITMKWRAYIIHPWNIAVKSWPSTGTLATKVAFAADFGSDLAKDTDTFQHLYLGVGALGLSLIFHPNLLLGMVLTAGAIFFASGDARHTKLTYTRLQYFHSIFMYFPEQDLLDPKFGILHDTQLPFWKKKFSSSLAACFPSPSHHPRLVAAISTSPKLWLC